MNILAVTRTQADRQGHQAQSRSRQCRLQKAVPDLPPPRLSADLSQVMFVNIRPPNASNPWLYTRLQLLRPTEAARLKFAAHLYSLARTSTWAPFYSPSDRYCRSAQLVGFLQEPMTTIILPSSSSTSQACPMPSGVGERASSPAPPSASPPSGSLVREIFPIFCRVRGHAGVPRCRDRPKNQVLSSLSSRARPTPLFRRAWCEVPRLLSEVSVLGKVQYDRQRSCYHLGSCTFPPELLS